ncbi:MAG TPA: hypothetical protein VF939_06830 [Puia sp.]
MKKIIYCSLFLFAAAIVTLSFETFPESTTDKGKPVKVPPKDSVGSVKAFLYVYKVIMSPRCMNCHPSGDVPLQGDDSHLHTMGITRGSDGKGVYAVKCANCHQPENTAGLHAPPGNPKWSMPPASMRMVFQGRSPRQLALQILDPRQNGGRTKEQLYDHMAKDDLVGWAWHPGDGRTLPPMTRPAFAEQVKLWLDKGAFSPAK